MGFVAGEEMTVPFSSKREPWQGQSQVWAEELYLRAQPKWEQRGRVGVRRFTVLLAALEMRGGSSMGREGRNTRSNSYFWPVICAVRSFAATMDEVMPQALKPVAT